MRRLASASARREDEAFRVEGPHVFERLLSALAEKPDLPYRVRTVLVSEPYRDRFIEQKLDARLARMGAGGGFVTTRVMEQLSDTVAPQGVLAVVSLPASERDQTSRAHRLEKRRTLRIVLAEGVSDPGNLGTLIRSAAAMGAHLFLSHGGADPFGPKVLRASAGAFLDVPIGEVDDPAGLLRTLQRAGVKVLATVPRGGSPLDAYRPPGRCILLLGSEPRGLPAPWVRHADVRLTIPLQRGVESLNVAVAGSLILYHLSRSGRPARA